jgi:hypothetical protein
MRRNVTDFDRQDIDALILAGSGGRPAVPTIHLMLQGKGGVGKSLVSSILAQYFRHRGADTHCLDTDPVNQTFSQYVELAGEHLESMRDGKIDSRGFDVLMERLLTDDGIFIVENNVLELLRAAGRRLCVHTVVTGRQALGDTLKGFKSLAGNAADRNIVVWLNEYSPDQARRQDVHRDAGLQRERVETLRHGSHTQEEPGYLRARHRRGHRAQADVRRRDSQWQSVSDDQAAPQSGCSGISSSSWTKCRCCERRNARRDVKRLTPS